MDHLLIHQTFIESLVPDRDQHFPLFPGAVPSDDTSGNTEKDFCIPCGCECTVAICKDFCPALEARVEFPVPQYMMSFLSYTALLLLNVPRAFAIRK